jgi:GAF domain-containing protein
VKEDVVRRLSDEVERLRHENEELLGELENSYAQLTAVMQVSQDETRIAYGELQEKLVVLEKKLVELSFLSDVGEALGSEFDLPCLQRAIVEKICLILPVDLVSLHLAHEPGACVQRERDVVRETPLDSRQAESLQRLMNRLDRDGAGPLLVSDLSQAPDEAGLRLRPDARSAACVPLRAGRLLGMLVLNSRLRANFREDQEPLLAAFGSQSGAALENALRIRRYQDVLLGLTRAQHVSIEEIRRCAGAALDAAAAAENEALRHELHALLRDGRTGAAEGGPGRKGDS